MELLHYVIDSDVYTKIFIISSILVLLLIQWLIIRFRIGWLLIPLLHIAFGYLLSFVTTYNLSVHILLYVIPSLSMAILLYFSTRKPVTNIGEFPFTYRTDKGDLVLYNIFRGMAIFGGPGSGKTESLIKPTIKNMAAHKFCGVIYDYKKFQLTKYAYTLYRDIAGIDFRMINFFDLAHSYRVNPISPQLLTSPAYATEAAHVLISNLSRNKESAGVDHSWDDAATGVLASVFWKLREDHPSKCYLSYAVSICLNSTTEELVSFIESNLQAKLLAGAFLKSLDSPKTRASVLFNLSNYLSKIALPEIFYITSGEDFTLDVNNPAKPVLLCVSNIQKLQASYSPVISLIISMALKQMNEEGKHPSAVLLDEGTTLVIPGFDNIPNTARSNRVAAIFCIQDKVQGEGAYGRIGRDKILAGLTTMFFGRVTNPETAEWYSKMYGTYEKKMKSYSKKVGEFGASTVNESLREVARFKAQEFIHLETGKFFGIIADGNKKEFNGKFQLIDEPVLSLPVVNQVTEDEVKLHFTKILNESQLLIGA